MYFNHYTTKTTKTLANLPADYRKQAQKLKHLYTALKNIKKLDRLEHLKKILFRQAVARAKQNQDYASAQKWAKRWLAFDDRDLHAMAELATSIQKKNVISSEEQSFINTAQANFPEFYPFTVARLKKEISTKDYDKAYSIVEDFLTRNYKNSRTNWQIFWNDGTGFDQQKSLPFSLTSTENSVAVKAAAAIQSIRIDPPDFSWFMISNPKLTHIATNKTRDLKTVATVQNAKKQQNLILTTGQLDPYIVWQIPTAMQSSHISLTFLAEMNLSDEMLEGVIEVFKNKSTVTSNSVPFIYYKKAVARYLDAKNETQ